jgi:TolB-like protein
MLTATALSLAASVLLAQPDKPKLAVLELNAGTGVEASLTGPFTDAITGEVQARAYFDVISSRDIQALLGLERQKQLLGCADDAQSCMAELSGALGARFVLTGSLARLGDAWQLTLSTLDTKKAQPIGRATRIAGDLETLRRGLPSTVAEATATPLPAPPSRVLPITLIATGAAAGLFGVVWGALALTQQAQLSATLDAGANQPGVLSTRAAYEQQVASLTTQKWVALGTLIAGAALVTTGLLLWPPDDGRTRVSLVPFGAGLALVGSWP